ncbi:hypothetical protein H2199_005534 [Coniosporium tulheliwenetii]|uniref:Uncharacterized protein n=1 Tax=Coniosporium tulheliwenetii TaxID=3383036 RepID=A0ACC2Z1S6_9PEZI|nr:hypothetical protein H2199_005534 [Cladosporium sp. JES 115]
MRGFLSLFIALLASRPPKKDEKDKDKDKDKYTTECKKEYITSHTVVTSPYTTYTTKTVHVPETKVVHVPKTETTTKTKFVEDVVHTKKPVVYTDYKTVSKPYLVTVTSYSVETVKQEKTSYTRVEYTTTKTKVDTKEKTTSYPSTYTTQKEVTTHVPVTTHKAYTTDYVKTEEKCYTKKKGGHHGHY